MTALITISRFRQSSRRNFLKLFVLIMISSIAVTFRHWYSYMRSQGGAGCWVPLPNWNATNDKNVTKKPIASLVSVSFSIFLLTTKDGSTVRHASIFAKKYGTLVRYTFFVMVRMRSQESAMGGCLGGLGTEPPALENFAFFCKNNFFLGLFWFKNNAFKTWLRNWQCKHD